MAVAKHLEILNEGVDAWNAWRTANLRIRPVLTGADLRERDFSGVNFLKANLSGADLSGSRFRYANLRYTDFSGSDLTGADFTGANLMLADLTGANLRNASGLTHEVVEDALTDEATVLPDGMR